MIITAFRYLLSNKNNVPVTDYKEWLIANDSILKQYVQSNNFDIRFYTLLPKRHYLTYLYFLKDLSSKKAINRTHRSRKSKLANLETSFCIEDFGEIYQREFSKNIESLLEAHNESTSLDMMSEHLGKEIDLALQQVMKIHSANQQMF